VETLYGVFLCRTWLRRDATREVRHDDYHLLATELDEVLSSRHYEPLRSIWPVGPLQSHYPPLRNWLLSTTREKLYTRAHGGFEEPDTRTLRIAFMEMHSPGLISFEGLGEVLREAREFIKDIWWRNAAEKRSAELDLEAKDLETLKRIRDFNRDNPPLSQSPEFPNVHYRSLKSSTILLSGAVEEIIQLEDSGHVVIDPELLDKDPRDTQ
jgi:hypothetical protein